MRARVLILDDEDEVRKLVADVLSSDGYTGDTAHDGPEALSLLDQRRYDLIISDLRLPKLDGPALYEAIWERYRSEEMPRMIFVTDSAYEPHYAGFLEKVGGPLLVKPFAADQLRQMVGWMLKT